MNAEEYLKRGEEYSKNDEFDQAIADFTEAFRIDPNLEAAKNKLSIEYYSRGVASFKKGDAGSAIADINEAIKLTPNDASLYGARGYIYEESGNYNRAISDFTEAIRHAPTAPRYSSRANCYYQKCKEYRKAYDEKNFLKYYGLAINDQKSAVELDPTIADYKEILELMISERDKRMTEMDTSAYFERCITRVNKGELDGAIDDITEVIRLDENNIDAYSLRGALYDTKKQYDKVIDDFTKVIKLDENNITAYQCRGAAYYEKLREFSTKGDFFNCLKFIHFAIFDYEKALKLEPVGTDKYKNYQETLECLRRELEQNMPKGW